MRLFYTDDKNNKKLIFESDDVIEIAKAADEDAKTKFIVLKKLKLVDQQHSKYIAIDIHDKETGYSIE